MIEYSTVPVPSAEVWKENQTIYATRGRTSKLRLVRHSEIPNVAFLVDESNNGTYWSLRLATGSRVTLTCVSCCQKEHLDEISKFAHELDVQFIACRLHADPYPSTPLGERAVEFNDIFFLDGNAILQILTDSEKTFLEEIGTFATSLERDKT